jgi:ABC-type amino acid transport system permease subunit
MDAVVDNLDAYRQGFVTTLALTALSSVLALALGTLLAERRRRGRLSHATPLEVIS